MARKIYGTLFHNRRQIFCINYNVCRTCFFTYRFNPALWCICSVTLHVIVFFLLRRVEFLTIKFPHKSRARWKIEKFLMHFSYVLQTFIMHPCINNICRFCDKIRKWIWIFVACYESETLKTCMRGIQNCSKAQNTSYISFEGTFKVHSTPTINQSRAHCFVSERFYQAKERKTEERDMMCGIL